MASKKIQGITIKLGADTSSLDKALKDVNKNSSGLNSELKQVNKLLKFDPKNTELLAQKQKILADSIGNTEKKLDALKQAQGEVEKMFQNGDIGEKEYREFQRTLAETEQSLKSYTKQVEALDEATKKSTSRLSGFSEAAKKAGGKIKGVGKSLIPISGAMSGIGLASAKMSLDFEDAMAKVSTIADTSQVPMKDLEKSIIDLSNETGISSTQIADNVYNAISAGQKTGDAVNFVRNSTKLAKAGFADAGSALDVLTSIMNAYGMKAEDVTKVSDILIQTQNLGKTTVGNLSTEMGKIIPTAKANSVALEQVAAGYAIMTSKGVNTAESTTYMNSMLNELGKTGTKASNALKEKTGKSFSELMESGMSLSDVLKIVSDSAEEQGLKFGDMWGSAEAGKAGMILLGDSADDFNGKLKEMQDSTGATDEAFKKVQTKSEELKKVFNEVKNTAIELGNEIMEVLGPMLKALADKIRDFTKWFSGLDEGTKKMIVIIGLIVAIAAPILMVVGNLIIFIGAIVSMGGAIAEAGGIMAILSSAFSTLMGVLIGPIGLIIAIAAAFVLAYTKIKPFRDFINGLVEDIKNFAERIYNEYIGPALGAVKGAFESALSAITGFWNDYGAQIIEAVQNLFAFLSPIIFGNLGWIKGTFSAVFDTVVDIVKTAWNFIEGIFSGTFDVIKGILKVFAGIFTGDMKTLVSGVKDIFKGMFGFLESGFKALNDTIGAIVKGLANGIIAPIGDAVNGVIKGINWILKKVGSDKKFDLWEVPHFAKGAGGIKKDTIGVVNDQKGSVYREMVVPPNGKPFIPAGRDVVLPLKKGTKIMPAKQTKDFLSGIPHFAGGIGDFFGNIWEGIKDFTGNVWDYISHPSKIVQIAIDKFTDLAGIVEPWLSVATGAVNTVVDGVVDFIKGIFDTQSNVNYNPTAGVEQWRSLAKKALEMEGQYSEANLERLLYQMQTESGGNPNAINDWDINAINGTPSKGLLQVIDPTFRTYARPGFDSNIWDPLSNMLASIRYAVSRYGSLAAAYRGVGYKDGIGNIDLSTLIPNIPTLDVRWFKEGGILTKPAFFNMGNGRTGGAGEAGPEAIAPINKLREYIRDGILEVFGDKDINITMNITQTLDGKTTSKQLLKYIKPLLDDMDKFQNRLKGVR